MEPDSEKLVGTYEDILYVEVEIKLYFSYFDFHHINPDFLRYNDIVGRDLKLERPVSIEPNFRLINFSNGITIFAGSNHMDVSQVGSPLDMERWAVPEVVVNYLEITPGLEEWQRVEVSARGIMNVASQNIHMADSPISRWSPMADYEDVVPEIQSRISYSLPGRSIVLYVAEAYAEGTNTIARLHFTGEITREVDSELSVDERMGLIRPSIDTCRADIEEFEGLARHIHSLYLGRSV